MPSVHRFQFAVWLVAFITFVLITLSALGSTASFITPFLRDFPGPYGRSGLLFTALYFFGGALALAAVWWLSRRGVHRYLLPLSVIGLTLLLRTILDLIASAPLYGENRIVHELAVGVLDGRCCFSHRPMGYPIALAGAYSLLGVGPMAIELLNLCLAGITAWLLWDVGRLTWGPTVGSVAAGTYAVMPSQILMSLVPLTEPMYTVLLLGAVWTVVRRGSDPSVSALVGGAALASAQYVRATAVAMLIPFALLPMVIGRGRRATIRHAVLLVGAFLIVMLPAVDYNLRVHDEFSVATSAYAGWSLYVGTNQRFDGQWNREDAARLLAFPGRSWWEKSEYAGGQGIQRIVNDPVGFANLIPRKFSVQWGDERYAAAYALASGPPTQVVWVGWLVSQLMYVAVLVLACVSLLSQRLSPTGPTLLIGMIMVVVVVSHLFLEVHGRYHSYLVPAFCLLAAHGARVAIRVVGQQRGG